MDRTVIGDVKRSRGSDAERWRGLRPRAMKGGREVHGVLHPLFVHLHIALLFMAFVCLYYWLFKGLATSIFEKTPWSSST
jgi:hypothetical protein